MEEMDSNFMTESISFWARNHQHDQEYKSNIKQDSNVSLCRYNHAIWIMFIGLMRIVIAH
ncbi:hypothetical protein BD408DRAFT_416603 [Parasitella parasitica]|nr:hypothetical protein BD408DRAFT_416603 [Parasitella parasitica]